MRTLTKPKKSRTKCPACQDGTFKKRVPPPKNYFNETDKKIKTGQYAEK